MAYYQDIGVECDLTDIDRNKTLNKRESKRELKHIKQLISDRDQWELEHENLKVKEANKLKRKMNTKKGRVAAKKKVEDNETKRLAKKAELEANTSKSHSDKPKGLALFSAYRRERAARKSAEEEPCRKTVSEASGSTATGKVKPLNCVLNRQQDQSLARPIALFDTTRTTKPGTPSESLHHQQLFQTLANDNANNNTTVMDHTVAEDGGFVKPRLPRGYVKADTLRIMKGLYDREEDIFLQTKAGFLQMENNNRVMT